MVNPHKLESALPGTTCSIHLIVDPGRARLWHRALAARLSERGHDVTVMQRPGAPRQPAAIGLIKSFERLIQRRQSETPGSDWAEAGQLPASEPATSRPDLVLDMTGQTEPQAGDVRVLRPVYGDSLIEEGALAQFLDGVAPSVGILDSAAMERPQIATVAVEDRLHLSRALDNLGARLCGLMLTAVDRASAGETIAGDAPTKLRDAHQWRLGSSYRGLTLKAQQVLNRLMKIGPHWYTGWRRTSGDRVADTLALAPTGWNRLPDDGKRFYADPFMAVHEGRTWLFLEEFPYSTQKGILSVVEIGPSGPVGTPRPILETESHLSYPFIFQHEGEWLMMPESSGARRVELFRAVEFPHRWEPHHVMMDGIDVHDGTLLHRDGRWWLFGARGAAADSSWDNLHLWSSPDLFGSWTAHDRNPVLVSAQSARPAGAFFQHGGELWRPAQDCTAGYGSALALARVTKLDDEGFGQEVVTILKPGAGWPGKGLHSLNWAGGIEVIDGMVEMRRP